MNKDEKNYIKKIEKRIINRPNFSLCQTIEIKNKENKSINMDYESWENKNNFLFLKENGII